MVGGHRIPAARSQSTEEEEDGSFDLAVPRFSSRELASVVQVSQRLAQRSAGLPALTKQR